MKRQPSAAKNHEAVLAWGPARIVAYTRATLDSTFLAMHLRLHQPTTPEVDDLLADILGGKVKAKPRPSKKWLSPEALAVFRHWHELNRTKLEEGDAGVVDFAKAIGQRVALKGDRTKAAWHMTGAIFSISAREAKKLYYAR
jgi:hypothetical protein